MHIDLEEIDNVLQRVSVNGEHIGWIEEDSGMFFSYSDGSLLGSHTTEERAIKALFGLYRDGI